MCFLYRFPRIATTLRAGGDGNLSAPDWLTQRYPRRGEMADEQDQRGGDAGDTAKAARSAFEQHVADPARRAGDAMRASGENIVRNSSQIGVTIIDQAQANAQEAFAALRAAAQANDLSQVMQIQGDYLRDQGKRSMEQAREIGEMIMRFGREAVTPVKRDG
jgi:hypothetical protein